MIFGGVPALHKAKPELGAFRGAVAGIGILYFSKTCKGKSDITETKQETPFQNPGHKNSKIRLFFE